MDSLKADYEVLEQRTHEKMLQLEAAQAALKDLVGRLVDATPKARPALVQERIQLAAERDCLGDELSALKSRRDAAHLAVFQSDVDQAQSAYNAASEAARKVRMELNALLDEQRRFYGGGRGRLPQAEGDAKMLELETDIARLKVAGALAERELNQSGFTLKVAKAALETALSVGD